jgi:hypothetical protein
MRPTRLCRQGNSAAMKLKLNGMYAGCEEITWTFTVFKDPIGGVCKTYGRSLPEE